MLNFYPDYARYSSENSSKVTAMYLSLAKKHGLKPAQMALANINDRAFITANIIGATKMQQLRDNIGSTEVKLSENVLAVIVPIHQLYPNPGPWLIKQSN